MALKQKHVDASREVRMWIRDIVLPVGVLVCGLILTKMSERKDRKSENACEYGHDENGAFIRVHKNKPDIIV